MLQVVILGLLPVTLSKVAVLPGLTEKVMLVPVPISSASFLLISAPSRTGAVQQVPRAAASCSDRALRCRLRTLKVLSQQIPLAQEPAMSSSWHLQGQHHCRCCRDRARQERNRATKPHIPAHPEMLRILQTPVPVSGHAFGN